MMMPPRKAAMRRLVFEGPKLSVQTAESAENLNTPQRRALRNAPSTVPTRKSVL
jgi:hypothetical protein